MTKPLVAILLSFGILPTASAQPTPPLTCTATPEIPPIVRAEGLTELVANLIIACVGGMPTPAGAPVPRADLFGFLNVGATSRMFPGGATDALLMVDEPVPGTQRLCDSPNGCSLLGTGNGKNVYDGSPGRPNVYQGRVSGNSLMWLGVPVDPPGTTVTRIIRITNVRANANQLGVNAMVPTQIIMFASGQFPNFPVSTGPMTVGFGLQSILTAIDPPAPRTLDGCIAQNPGLVTGTGTAGLSQFSVRVHEQFPKAFRRRNVALPMPFNPNVSPPPVNQNIPGFRYNTETGFFNMGFATLPSGDFSKAGLADHGTRVLLRFDGVPAGPQLFADVIANLVNQVTGAVTGAARMVNTDANGAGPFNPVMGNASGIARIPVVNGVARATYEVLTETIDEDLKYVTAPIYVGYENAINSSRVTTTLSYRPTNSPFAIPNFADPALQETSTVDAFTINGCQSGRPNNTLRITAKSGPVDTRSWTATIFNSGQGPALSARIDSFRLTQVAGIPCTPVLLRTLPVNVGDIPAGGSGGAILPLNFTGCPANARFFLTSQHSSNAGAFQFTNTLTNMFP